jgi:hypothetical protein
MTNIYKRGFIIKTHMVREISLRRIGWVWYIACIGEIRTVDNVLVRVNKGKKSCRTPSSRWQEKKNPHQK